MNSLTLAPVSRGASRAGGFRQMLAASVGNSMEWFDWTGYVTFAAVLGGQFFPAGHASANLLQTLLVFAVGFLFRPIGSVVIGAYSDRHGRSRALRLSVLAMSGGSLLIALAPGYSAVGVLSPLLLVLARALQGLSAGGESSAMSTYVIEVAPPGRRGLYASTLYISSTVGTLAATLLALLLQSTLTAGQLDDWGWRVPFVLGALFSLYGWQMRRRMHETPVFETTHARRRNPAWQIMRSDPRRVLRVAAFSLGATVVYYTFASYLPVYAHVHYGMDANAALWAAAVAQVVFITALPLIGMAADRFGSRTLLLVFGGGFVCLSPLFFRLMSSSATRLSMVMTVVLLLFGCYATAAPPATMRMFPTALRSTGSGVPYALTVAVFGGTAPYLNAYLSAHGHAGWYPWYISALCAISVVSFFRYREEGDVDLTALEDA